MVRARWLPCILSHSQPLTQTFLFLSMPLNCKLYDSLKTLVVVCPLLVGYIKKHKFPFYCSFLRDRLYPSVTHCILRLRIDARRLKESVYPH